MADKPTLPKISDNVLATLDLDMLGHQLPLPAVQVIADGFLLRLQPEAAFPLTLGGAGFEPISAFPRRM